jgi:hypothetical protein
MQIFLLVWRQASQKKQEDADFSPFVETGISEKIEKMQIFLLVWRQESKKKNRKDVYFSP